jgi:hypothetical protein
MHSDDRNKFIGIYATMTDTSLKTNKEITKGNTIEEVEKVYGSNFLKKKYSDFMGRLQY